jgi:hypothetical protein
MRGSVLRHVFVFVLVGLTATACSSSTIVMPTPTPPSITEPPFTGNLTLNGAVTYAFVAGAAGTVTVSLTSLTPDSTLLVGLSLGVWNATSGTCSVSNTIQNTSATQGTVLTGLTTVASNLCVQVFDAHGDVPTTETFTVIIVHP